MAETHEPRLAPARQPLLVPVDFSDCSRAALLYASRLVEGTRTPLLLLHVIHDDVRRPGVYRSTSNHYVTRPITDIAAEMVEEMLTELRDQEPGLQALQTVEPLLIRGLPGRRIIEVAEREHALMIIMGTHGRNGFAHLMQGSVAEYVAKYARSPVMTVKDDNYQPGSLNLSWLDTASVPGGI
ncbi:MAG TPA: universal stress protein [Gammaproteobacteria bacterium]|nr:universal stress protein [Gammaproteobacteria bacterium]